MVTKKDLVIAVLTTFCLTATLFMILPTKSSPAEYDPWLDVNDDGTINIIDLATTAKAYGASGDPTKPVEIAERRVEENVIDFVIDESIENEPYSHFNITIPTAGFRIVTVSIWAYQFDPTYFDYFIGYRVADRWVNASLKTGFSQSAFSIIDPNAGWWENIREPHPSLSWTEEIWFSELVITIINLSGAQKLTATAVYYLST